MRKNFNAVIFKILILYLGTSILLLGFIFFMMYHKGLHNLRIQQMIQIRTNYIQIVTTLYEQNLDSAIKTLPSMISTPFALIDSADNVVFSNLTKQPQSVLKALDNNAFVEIDASVFFDMRRNKTFEHILTQPPFNLAKRPKKEFKHFEKLHLRVILQSDAIDDIKLPFLQHEILLDSPSSKSIQEEITTLRLEIVLYLLCALCVMGVVAYVLVRLSFRPIAEKIQTLERFIKDTTHEINTPLSVILMSTQKFDTTKLSAANLKWLNHIKLSAQNLHRLYRNLIFLNLYNKKGVQNSINLKTLILQRIEYFSPLIAQKLLTLHTQLTPTHIDANLDEITILLDNLLSNAIKYNHKGGNITIKLESTQLSISDSGYGIDKNQMAHIFERYVRCNDDQGGFGIGLALVREIATRYGMQVSVQSEVGKGSVFIVAFKE